MFYVKSLPLSPDMNVSILIIIKNKKLYKIDEMSEHLHTVFNTYNLNILFTTHHMPAKVNVNAFNPAQMQSMQQK